MIKKLIAIALILFLLVNAFLAWLWIDINQAMNKSQMQLPQSYLLTPGTTALRLVKDLSAQGQLDIDLNYFRLWAKFNPEKSQLKKGYYQIPPETSLLQLLTLFNQGKTKQFSITLVEGLRFKDWYIQLQSVDTLTQDLGPFSDLYERLVIDGSFCENVHRNLEGCLLPDTYQYEYQDSAFSILSRAYQAMEVYLNDQWGQKLPGLPLNSPYESLILASIIEKETAVAEERGVIAGVFINRLQQGMRLQTDPTVIYGIGDDFDGNITRKHLRTTTPYNTYRIDGLPITPIAMPSRASIDASLQADYTEYLYFVAKGDGTHQFSETLDQHNQAVRRYQLGQN